MVMAGGKEMQDPLEIAVMKVLFGIVGPCVEVVRGICSGDISSGKFLLLVCFPGK